MAQIIAEQDWVTAAPGAGSTSFIGVEGKLSRYAVRPVTGSGGVIWLDPAGFQVAESINARRA